eukprot:CFRG0778T1
MTVYMEPASVLMSRKHSTIASEKDTSSRNSKTANSARPTIQRNNGTASIARKETSKGSSGTLNRLPPRAHEVGNWTPTSTARSRSKNSRVEKSDGLSRRSGYETDTGLCATHSERRRKRSGEKSRKFTQEGREIILNSAKHGRNHTVGSNSHSSHKSVHSSPDLHRQEECRQIHQPTTQSRTISQQPVHLRTPSSSKTRKSDRYRPFPNLSRSSSTHSNSDTRSNRFDTPQQATMRHKPFLTERQQLAILLRESEQQTTSSTPGSEIYMNNADVERADSESDVQITPAAVVNLSHAADLRNLSDGGYTPTTVVNQSNRVSVSNSRTNSRSKQGSTNRINVKNQKGETQLQRAAIKGDINVVQSLIKRGANVHSRDNAGWTSLHEASNHGHMEIVQLLLEAGAQPDTRGLGGDMPLHDAAANGHMGIARLLVRYGANILAPNDDGITPVDAATNDEMHEYLQTQSRSATPCSQVVQSSKRLNTIQYDDACTATATHRSTVRRCVSPTIGSEKTVKKFSNNGTPKQNTFSSTPITKHVPIVSENVSLTSSPPMQKLDTPTFMPTPTRLSHAARAVGPEQPTPTSTRTTLNLAVAKEDIDRDHSNPQIMDWASNRKSRVYDNIDDEMTMDRNGSESLVSESSTNILTAEQSDGNAHSDMPLLASTSVDTNCTFTALQETSGVDNNVSSTDLSTSKCSMNTSDSVNRQSITMHSHSTTECTKAKTKKRVRVDDKSTIQFNQTCELKSLTHPHLDEKEDRIHCKTFTHIPSNNNETAGPFSDLNAACDFSGENSPSVDDIDRDEEKTSSLQVHDSNTFAQNCEYRWRTNSDMRMEKEDSPKRVRFDKIMDKAKTAKSTVSINGDEKSNVHTNQDTKHSDGRTQGCRSSGSGKRAMHSRREDCYYQDRRNVNEQGAECMSVPKNNCVGSTRVNEMSSNQYNVETDKNNRAKRMNRINSNITGEVDESCMTKLQCESVEELSPVKKNSIVNEGKETANVAVASHMSCKQTEKSCGSATSDVSGQIVYSPPTTPTVNVTPCSASVLPTPVTYTSDRSSAGSEKLNAGQGQRYLDLADKLDKARLKRLTYFSDISTDDQPKESNVSIASTELLDLFAVHKRERKILHERQHHERTRFHNFVFSEITSYISELPDDICFNNNARLLKHKLNSARPGKCGLRHLAKSITPDIAYTPTEELTLNIALKGLVEESEWLRQRQVGEWVTLEKLQRCQWSEALSRYSPIATYNIINLSEASTPPGQKMRKVQQKYIQFIHDSHSPYLDENDYENERTGCFPWAPVTVPDISVSGCMVSALASESSELLSRR